VDDPHCAGRFANIGIPIPELLGPVVGTVEIICGALIILGLLTRPAAVPLIIILLVAIISTKVPIWLSHDFWIFHVPNLTRYGFWSMAHEARTDFCMLLGSPSADRGRRQLVHRCGTRRRKETRMTNFDSTRRRFVIAASTSGAGLMVAAANSGIVRAAEKNSVGDEGRKGNRCGRRSDARTWHHSPRPPRLS
jgi:DoxX